MSRNQKKKERAKWDADFRGQVRSGSNSITSQLHQQAGVYGAKNETNKNPKQTINKAR